MEGKNIRVEKLVDGEIYYEDMGNGNTYISLYKENEVHNNIYIQINRKTFNKTGEGVKLYNVQRVATELEKAWLNYCIEKDKYISYEDFLKEYKPTYEKGKWYKLKTIYDWYAKFEKFSDNCWYASEFIDVGDKSYKDSQGHWDWKNTYKSRLVTDLKEIESYLPKDHPDKIVVKLTMEEIQEECKRRFPIGCKYKCANHKREYTLKKDESVYHISDSHIFASNGQGCLYSENKYAELIEKSEIIIPEYVEYLETKYKGKIVKVEDWCSGSYCKVLFSDGNKEQPFKHLVKISTKEAYDLQNSKQYPLVPEECYNTEIEVGDEVEVIQPCSSSLNKKGHIGRVEKIFQGRLIDFGSCQVYEINGWCEHISALKLVKKANKTTTLDKKVDVSSPKVTNKITVPIINTTSRDKQVHINVDIKKDGVIVPLLTTTKKSIKNIQINNLKTLTI